MKKYYVDFEGWTVVEAVSKEDAEQKFFENYILPPEACELNIEAVDEYDAKHFPEGNAKD